MWFVYMLLAIVNLYFALSGESVGWQIANFAAAGVAIFFMTLRLSEND